MLFQLFAFCSGTIVALTASRGSVTGGTCSTAKNRALAVR